MSTQGLESIIVLVRGALGQVYEHIEVKNKEKSKGVGLLKV